MGEIMGGRVILYVSDMAAAVRFYRDELGLELSWPQVADYSAEAWVTFVIGGMSLALHSGGQKRLGEDTPEIQFMCANLQAKREDILARGLPCEEIVNPHPGVEFFALKDPDGVRISFQQV